MTGDAAPAIRRAEFYDQGVAGHPLFRRNWIPEDPRRSVVLVHGYGEHSGRYEHVGVRLARASCAVYAYDHQGHGKSGGRRCHVRRFDDFLDDLSAVVESVRAEAPARPVFVLGHRMGGLIVSAFARERHPDVAGVATSGAALELSDDLTGLKLLAARWLARVLPRLSMASDLDPNGLSRDPEVVRAYLEDPLVQSRLTLSLGAEMLAAIARTSVGAGDVEVPMLLLHGEDDPLCPARGSRAFFEQLKGDKQIRIYPGLKHEIFNEPERETVLDDLVGWLEER